jgi:ribosome-associated protein
MQAEAMKDLVVHTLDQAKGQDIRVLDVHGLTDITDYMVVVTGTSDRHLRSMADKVADALREQGCRPLGTEGESGGEWVLIDFGDVLVHLMLPEARTFYDLEKLWDEDLREVIEAHRNQGPE